MAQAAGLGLINGLPDGSGAPGRGDPGGGCGHDRPAIPGLLVKDTEVQDESMDQKTISALTAVMLLLACTVQAANF